MNHQIQDNIDVSATLPIGREAMTLDKPRRAQIWLRGQDRGIETLEVPDLEDALLPRFR
jgi:hypothetical protein